MYIVLGKIVLTNQAIMVSFKYWWKIKNNIKYTKKDIDLINNMVTLKVIKMEIPIKLFYQIVLLNIYQNI